MVSIIIPIRRGENITKLLDYIHKSYYKDYEIIVVDEGLERSRQRNIGINRAKGEYILILDSDQYPSKLLLGECVELMKQDWDALYIPELIITDGWFAQIRNWERQFYNGTPIDCVRFVRNNYCPYFDETMSGPEDSDWDRRVRGDRTITENRFYHNDNVGLVDYFKKKAYYSESMERFEFKNPNDKVLNFWWRCFGVFFEEGKWRRVLKAPHLFICVMLIIFIRGIIYLVKK